MRRKEGCVQEQHNDLGEAKKLVLITEMCYCSRLYGISWKVSFSGHFFSPKVVCTCGARRAASRSSTTG